jgi:hypothetical protein
MRLRFIRVLAVQVAIAGAILGVAGAVVYSFTLSRAGAATAALALAGYAALRSNADGKVTRWALVAGLVVIGGAAALGLLGYVAATLALAYWLPLMHLPCTSCVVLPEAVWNGFQWGMVLTAVAGVGLFVSAITSAGQRPSRAVLSAAIGIGVSLPVLLLILVRPRDPWPAVPSLIAAAVALGTAVVYVQRSITAAAGAALLALPALFALAPAIGFATAARNQAFTASALRYHQDSSPTSSLTIHTNIHPVALTVIGVVVAVVQIAPMLLIVAGDTRRAATGSS